MDHNVDAKSISAVLNLFSVVRQRKVVYSCLNTLPSALLSFLIAEGYQIEQCRWICKYLRVIQNIKASLPKYTYTWDVVSAMSYLAKTPEDDVKH